MGEYKVLYEEKGTIQYDSIWREDNSALHLFISYNTVKNVILSLFRTPVLYSDTIADTVHLIEGLVLNNEAVAHQGVGG